MVNFMGNTMEKDLQMTAASDFADLNIDEMKLPVSSSDLSLPVSKGLAKDEVPEDIRAFFGHPLTAATSALEGGETQASALALLHEYQNLPAIDRADLRIGDRYESIQDILRADLRRDGAPPSADYMMLMNADVDAYLNREEEAKADLGLAGLEEDENANMVMSMKSSDAAEEEFMQSLHKAESVLDSCVPGMALLDADDPESLLLPDGIKQEQSTTDDNVTLSDIRDVEMSSFTHTDQSGGVSMQSNHPFTTSLKDDAPPLSAESRDEQTSANPNQLHQNEKSNISPGKFLPAVTEGGVLPPFSFVRSSPPGLTPVKPEAAQPGTPTALLPPPPGLVFPLRLPTSDSLQTQPQQCPVPASFTYVRGPAPEPLIPQNGATPSFPIVRTLVPVCASGTSPTNSIQLESDALKFVAASTPNPQSSPSTVSMPNTLPTPSNSTETQNVTVTGLNSSMPAFLAQSLMALDSNPNLLVNMQHATDTSLSKNSALDPLSTSNAATTCHETPVSVTSPTSSPFSDPVLVKHFTSQATMCAVRPPLAPCGSPLPLTRPQLLDLQRLQLAGAPGIPAALTLMSPRLPPPPNYQEVAAAPRLPHSPPVSHPLPPTPAGSSDSNSVPNSPIPRKDTTGRSDSGSCSPDTQKPSDSTKRIIQALTEKLKRKKQQTASPDDDSRVSLNDINDIIKESIAEKAGLPDSIMVDGNLIDQVLVSAALESGQLTAPVFDIQKIQSSSSNSPPGPTISAGSPTSSAPPQPCPSTTTLAKPTSLPQLRPPAPFPSTPTASQPALFFPEVYNFQQVPNRTFPPPPGTPSPSPATTPVSESEAPPLVIQPQESFLPQTPLTPIQPPVVPYGDLKSPDSGFNEACVSPADPNLVYNDLSSSDPGALGTDPCRDRVGKRRRSSSSGSAKPFASNGTAKPTGAAIIIPKLENDYTGYKYVLETNTSTSQRLDEDRMTYLNKGQFYGLTLDYNPTGRSQQSSLAKSLIAVVFRDDKCVADELKAWEFWHSRQHSVKQRILDIDTKNSTGIVPNSIDEVAHNAVTVRWNPLDSAAKISIAINCLSTDFSNQKGVKGLPLHILIDTFDESSLLPVHRGYCQVKVFCDKGAERKTRDEERRKEAKSKTAESAGRKRLELYHPCCERSEFYPMANLTKKPVLFNPIPEYSDANYAVDPFLNSASPFDGRADGLVSPGKRPRLDSKGCRDLERVLLYVREGHESVYTALLLQTPTLQSLAHAVEEKYQIPATSIHNVYKRSKRGILVKMDDNIIRHYSNETTFVISITKNEHMLDCQSYDVTLAEIETEDA